MTVTITEIAHPANSVVLVHGINNTGVVVGLEASPAGLAGFEYSNGSLTVLSSINQTATDLNSLLPANSGWVLQIAVGINDQGQIVGDGSHNGVNTSFLLDLGSASAAQSAIQSFSSGNLVNAIAVSDSAANVQINLDGLEKMAAAGKLASITLTDGSTPTIALSAQQLSSDSAVLRDIKNGFNLSVADSGATLDVSGLAGHSTTVIFSGPSSQYRFAATTGDAVGVTDNRSGAIGVLSNVSKLQFSDGVQGYVLSSGAATIIENPGILTNYGAVVPLEINAQGQIVGVAGPISYPATVRGVYWVNGGLTGLAPLAGGIATEAYGINSLGQVVGESYVSTGLNFGTSEAVLWSNQAAASGAAPSDLGKLPGDAASFATDINDQGQVVGLSLLNSTSYRGFLWQNGVMTDLGSLGGSEVQPYRINQSGQVVGLATNSGGINHAFLWQNGSMTDLGTLTGSGSSSAVAINNSGIVVGSSTGAAGVLVAAEWKNGVIASLGALGGGNSSVANGISDAGVIVGESNTASGVIDAVMWADGTIIDLNTLLPSTSGWHLVNATAINSANQVVGTASYNGSTTSFELTLPTLIPLSASTALTNSALGLVYGPVTITDSSANVAVNLDGLQTLANAKLLGGIVLTDGTIPNITVTAQQLSNDAATINTILGSFTITVDAAVFSQTITGPAGHGSTVVFNGNAAQFTVAPSGDGSGFTLTNGGLVDHLSNVTALQFNDRTEMVATTPGVGHVTTGNVTELFGAVFGREPDVAGLAYYQEIARGNFGPPLTVYAQWFLASPEYTSNSAHNYAQTADGDTQFITDSYNNLLHRAPGNGDVAWYQANVVAAFLNGLTPGTAAYGAAELQAHAALLVDFSASSEFLANVQITAAHPADAQHWLILI